MQEFAIFIIGAETPDPLQASEMIPIAIEQDNLTLGTWIRHVTLQGPTVHMA